MTTETASLFDKPSTLPLNFAEILRDDSFVDYYDLLGIPPDAEQRTVQRVCRLLAMRYHPSNPDTGDVETFRGVQNAYRILTNWGLRTQYDAAYWVRMKQVWRLDDPLGLPASAASREKAILALLYRIRRLWPENPEASLDDLQEILDCDHLQLRSTLDALAGRWLLGRAGDDLHFITADGVDRVDQWAEQSPIDDRLATSAAILATNRNAVWDAIRGWYSPDPLPPKDASVPAFGDAVFCCPRPGSRLAGDSPGLRFIHSFPSP